MIIFQSSDQANMTVVNIKGWGSSLKDLDKFILMALFKGNLESNFTHTLNASQKIRHNKCYQAWIA